MSRFVSGGDVDQPIERDDAWLKAEQELEAKRKQKAEEGRQDGGKSLFETLQANKAAKQEAFEEAARLKNQFRSLDDDEVDFLDSVLESTRAKEAAVKKETAEQLELFRQLQEKTEKAAQGESAEDQPAEETTTWAVGGKKRKRNKDKEAIPGVKLRKSSSVSDQLSKPLLPAKANTAEVPSAVESSKARGDTQIAATSTSTGTATAPSKSPSPPAGLGLAAYSSDED